MSDSLPNVEDSVVLKSSLQPWTLYPLHKQLQASCQAKHQNISKYYKMSGVWCLVSGVWCLVSGGQGLGLCSGHLVLEAPREMVKDSQMPVISWCRI